jgi:hypothetical protein
MVIAVTIFAAGSLYIYATFSGVTRSSRTATLEIDLGSQNKRALTKIFNELQATSLTAQDTDGLDSTEPEAVCVIEDDTGAPAPASIALLVNRVDSTYVETNSEGDKLLGDSTEQARERVITQNRRVRYRKVVGYQFNAGAGTIMPEWSNWITLRELVREVPGRQPRVISNRVDAFHAEARPDGTIRVTLVSARRDPVTSNWRRYANAVIIHPKN